jgi:hypothetical protein
MTKKPTKFAVQYYIDKIPWVVEKILSKQNVTQLTEKQAMDLVKLSWWDDPQLTQDQIMVMQLYMIRQILPIKVFVDGIGCELNKPVSIENIQDYRYTLLEYYRRKFTGDL